MSKILVTGATGFVGSNLLAWLENKFEIIAPVRYEPNHRLTNVTYLIYDDLNDISEDNSLFYGVDVVIHVAAKAHSPDTSQAEYDRINKACTLKLAEQSARCNVKRFVFLSSIGVNGSKSKKPFTNLDKENPTESYAKSKYDAEMGLKRICEKSDLEYVIIRPPLVYGKGAPGNFSKLVRLSKTNIPLPLGCIKNKRSFVSIYNLVDFITVCVNHENAKNQIFLVSDKEIISTTKLIETIRELNKQKRMLIPIPYKVLLMVGSIFGLSKTLDKLCCDLAIDLAHTTNTLDWKPKKDFNDAIKDCL